MISYMDRSWCSLWESCKNAEGCDRAFTLEHQQRAEEWMSNPPISFMEFPCYVEDD